MSGDDSRTECGLRSQLVVYWGWASGSQRSNMCGSVSRDLRRTNGVIC